MLIEGRCGHRWLSPTFLSSLEAPRETSPLHRYLCIIAFFLSNNNQRLCFLGRKTKNKNLDKFGFVAIHILESQSELNSAVPGDSWSLMSWEKLVSLDLYPVTKNFMENDYHEKMHTFKNFYNKID